MGERGASRGRLAFALLALPLSCATIGTATAHRPRLTSARDYLHFFWNRPDEANAQYGDKPAVVAGLVETVREDPARGQVLDLQTDERSYVLHCWLRPGQRTGELRPGQLVEVMGVGVAAPEHSPDLKACEVTWSGSRLESTNVNDSGPKVAALSFMLCGDLTFLDQLDSRTKGATDTFVTGLRTEVSARVSWLRNEITAIGGTALPCDHPLAAIAGRCFVDNLGQGTVNIVEGNRLFIQPPKTGAAVLGSECESPEVKLVLTQLQIASRESERVGSKR